MKTVILLAAAIIAVGFFVDDKIPQKKSYPEVSMLMARVAYEQGMIREFQNPGILQNRAWAKDSMDIRHILQPEFQ